MKTTITPRIQTIAIDDLRRNFGEIKKNLPFVTYILTDRGKEIGVLSATKKMKREMMRSTAGAWKDTALDNTMLWKDVLKKHSRKEDITL